MKQVSTVILRVVIWCIAFIVFCLCLFVLPRGIADELRRSDFDYGYIMAGMYISAVPFLIALYQGLKLLDYIDRNLAFAKPSVKALGRIKVCAYIISAQYAAGMPYIFYVADRDDAPGVAAIGFIIIGAAFVTGAFASLAQKLFKHAAAIKAENEMTV